VWGTSWGILCAGMEKGLWWQVWRFLIHRMLIGWAWVWAEQSVRRRAWTIALAQLGILWWTDGQYSGWRWRVGAKCSWGCDWIRYSFLAFFFSFHFFDQDGLTFFPSAKYKTKSKGFLAKNRKLVIAILSIVVLLFMISLQACLWLMKRSEN